MNFANLDQQKTWGTMHGSWVKLSVAEALLDQDDDSLSDLMEIFTDSLATKKDSDGDLWSDYAEYISGTSPLDRHERPKVLVQDGDLVDWFELLPTKIREATNIPNQCDLPDVMDWYGAVAEEDRLLLAVHRKDGSRLPGYDWLVQIQIPVLNQLFSLRLSGDPGAHGNTSQDITVLAEESIRLEGKPESKQQEKFLTYQGRVFSEKGLELAFDPLKFGIPNLNLLQGGAVQVQISLLKGHGKKELLCGQTPWFSPVARTL